MLTEEQIEYLLKQVQVVESENDSRILVKEMNDHKSVVKLHRVGCADKYNFEVTHFVDGKRISKAVCMNYETASSRFDKLTNS